MLRSGLLHTTAPLALSAQINPAPSYRTINPLVYNSLPVALRGAIGGPLGPSATPVPIQTDGRATIFNIDAAPGSAPVVARNVYDLQFNQIIPKPFCASGPFDYIRVQGPITFRQTIVVAGNGNYLSNFTAEGMLELTPVNPLTGQAIGDTFRAHVAQHIRNIVTDQVTLISDIGVQVMIPPTGPFRGRLMTQLRLGPGMADASSIEVSCGS